MADSINTPDDAFAALSSFYLGDETLGDTLRRVAEFACKAAPADFAGISLLVNGKVRTGVFTDPTSPEIDSVQYETGKGPCLDAFRNSKIYVIPSTREDGRWPEFGRAAAERGIVSTVSVPLIARGEAIGALNLYSSQTGVFTTAAVQRVETFAAHAAVVMANAQVYADARELTEGLRTAMESRANIERAIGILMAPGGRSPEDAFQILVRASQRENRKLRDIATEIVERTLHRDRLPPPSGFGQ